MLQCGTLAHSPAFKVLKQSKPELGNAGGIHYKQPF
jgi:hypothetical protein